MRTSFVKSQSDFCGIAEKVTSLATDTAVVGVRVFSAVRLAYQGIGIPRFLAIRLPPLKTSDAIGLLKTERMLVKSNDHSGRFSSCRKISCTSLNLVILSDVGFLLTSSNACLRCGKNFFSICVFPFTIS